MRLCSVGLGLWTMAIGACARAPSPVDDRTSSSVAPAEPAVEVAPGPVATPEVASAPDPLPTGPVANEDSQRAHAQAQQRLLKSDELLPPLVPSPAIARGGPSEPDTPSEPDASSTDSAPMPGFFIPVTDPPVAPALASFHAALRSLAQGRDPDKKVRVAMYGASGTAADLAVGYVRTYLQSRFGDGGPGFVPLMPLSRWYRHNEVVVRASPGWRKEHAQITNGRLDGHYGLLGASFSATAQKRWGTVEPKQDSDSSASIAHIEVFYLRQPDGGSFRVQIDRKPAEVVNTAGEAFEPGYHSIEVEPGPHSIRVETVDRREVRVFGVVLERAEPGVVVDVLGINGTRGRNHLTWNESLWADNLQHRAPDLYTLAYGTNESVDEDFSLEGYTEDLRALLRRFAQTLPDASCLLIGPTDFPMIEDGQAQPRPVLRGIIEAQREVAAQEGCGFWDGLAFMGGELSMPAWVEADPPLAKTDHLHYTRRGSTRKGMALCDALMHRFDAQSTDVNVMPNAAASVGAPP